TNATKYGALSNDAGRVDLTTQVENEELVLRWDESGGPRIAGQPQTSGFGTVLSELSIEGQLGGRLSRNWAVEGLKVTAQVPCADWRRQATAAEALTEEPQIRRRFGHLTPTYRQRIGDGSLHHVLVGRLGNHADSAGNAVAELARICGHEQHRDPSATE